MRASCRTTIPETGRVALDIPAQRAFAALCCAVERYASSDVVRAHRFSTPIHIAAHKAIIGISAPMAGYQIMGFF